MVEGLTGLSGPSHGTSTEGNGVISGSASSISVKGRRSNWASLLGYLKTDIALEYADLPIIACCLVSGLCDSSAYNAWTCFVSMQTGNTIFLALGASKQPTAHSDGWVKSLVSIIMFLIGCLSFASTRFFHPKARGTLALSFFLQSCCIIVAAALAQGAFVANVVTEELHINYRELLPLSFLAFQSGGQIVTSRQLGFNEVPTTVLTSVYCDIASDPQLLKAHNVKRNRRVAAVISLLIGGIVGGWISKSSAGISIVFWMAAAIKMTIALSWSVWRANPPAQLPLTSHVG
ncbi:hypothetical protein B0O99DRAFT_589455 [Bisporella sp. PMI_857]|nr:hypothetical protein B0O99DRAFT_589455 [Bisporella sp. PMI_857]